MKEKDEQGYKTASRYSYGLLKAYAAENRKNMTLAEKLLWAKLKTNSYGLRFRRQHIIGDFIADFVCLSCRLVIEVDGAYHAELRQQLNDFDRTFDLCSLGFTVVRFTNCEVERDVETVSRKIYSMIFDLLEKQ
jgi:very-short-patch-repair endonuclease